MDSFKQLVENINHLSNEEKEKFLIDFENIFKGVQEKVSFIERTYGLNLVLNIEIVQLGPTQ
jgi:hypothetical protein